MKKIVAVMPIKMFNERLPGKNVRLLHGQPLLQYQLQVLRSVRQIDEIFVYCSDSLITEYIPEYVTFLKRNKELDLATSNFNQIFNSFMKEVDADIYIYSHATAPFIKSSSIQKCLDKVSSGEYDSAFTARIIQDFLWKDNKPLNFDSNNLPRSQDLPIIYRETSGIYIFTKEVFQKYNRRIGVKPYIHHVGVKEAIDINVEEDFKLAELLYNIDL